MTVIFLLDDNKGMLFNHRRLSRDEKILEDIAASLNGNLFINKFSEKLISSAGIRYTLFDHFPVEGKDEADYFIENFSVKEHLNEIDRIIVYWWNRKYPSDYQLDFEPTQNGFKSVSLFEFTGKSHEKITKEIFEK